MKANRNDLTVLSALFDLAQDDVGADERILAAKAGLSRTEIRAALCRLDEQGLVQGRLCRLTFPGLAVAASLVSRRADQRISLAA